MRPPAVAARASASSTTGGALRRPTFRRGRPSDAAAIRRLVLAERMNPLGLDPARFLVADGGGGDGELLAIGQLKPLAGGGGAVEVASLVTAPAARGAGVGAALLAALVDAAPPNASTIYLTTIEPRVAFYERAGFGVVAAGDVPRALWLEFCVGTVVARLAAGARLVVMAKTRE